MQGEFREISMIILMIQQHCLLSLLQQMHLKPHHPSPDKSLFLKYVIGNLVHCDSSCGVI